MQSCQKLRFEPLCEIPAAPRFSPNICNHLKICASLSKLLPVFLLGTEHVVRGMGIVVVVCGKIENICWPLKAFACVSLRYRTHCGGGGGVIVMVVCGKICGKIKNWNQNTYF